MNMQQIAQEFEIISTLAQQLEKLTTEERDRANTEENYREGYFGADETEIGY